MNIRSAIISLIALVILVTPSPAHEKGRIKLGSRQLAPGMALSLTGEKFQKNDTFGVYLVGLVGRLKVGEVRADGDGKFDGSVTVPAEAAAGSYRLVVMASDGDEAASVDVEVGAPGAQVAAEGEHQHDDGAPSGEPLALDRAGSPLVKGGAWAGVVVALGLGVTLLRRPK